MISCRYWLKKNQPPLGVDDSSKLGDVYNVVGGSKTVVFQAGSGNYFVGLVFDVFTGGTDSTYATLEWELSLLLRNPHTMKKLQVEVRKVANGKPKITEDDLDRMPYLKAVVKETFRMHMPLPLLVPRESTRNVKDVFTGGTDSTYATLEWELSELLRNPHAMRKLQEEVCTVANGKPKITEDDLDQMPNLKAVVKETFLMHMPLPLLVPRESTHDVKVMGYNIAAGTQVLINAWAVGRDPYLWDNPEEFRPERFLDSSVDYRGLHFELTPFGSGRRKCPGIQFAMSVNELVIASLVHKFDFRLPNAQKGEDLDMSDTIGITIHKKFPLLVVATTYN
ncbi:hypothetical protein L1987_53634 [Smallanthus sonchifolius]|uniref:Uncharacterized protein n=1 Tax=Smallanthus sonchifolius TaxID=185202 RepID=A0ACB9EXP0_9ASTR|nr:hypothetical protein L1987_53634 [Smallanthus sonchifolius]